MMLFGSLRVVLVGQAVMVMIVLDLHGMREQMRPKRDERGDRQSQDERRVEG
jgi:hypothetical protein